MKRTFFLLFVVALFSSESKAQHEAQAKSLIEKEFGANYTNFRYISRTEYYEKLRLYRSYMFEAELKKKPGFKCNTNAVMKQRMYVDIWSDGTLRKFISTDYPELSNMSELNWDQLNAEIKAVYKKGLFNPLDYFNASTLNDVLEIKDVSVVRPKDDEMKNDGRSNKPSWFYKNFEDSKILSENHIMIPVRISVRRICGRTEVCEASEVYYGMHFKRSDCGKAFEYVKLNGHETHTMNHKISESKVSEKEMENLKRQTLGRELAEKRAREEFNRLPKVSVPEFKSAREALWWTRQFMFDLNSPDELKAFIISNFDKKYFFDNSQFLLNNEGQRRLNNIMAAFAENEDYNFRNMYCPTVIDGKPDKNRYSFQSKNRKHTTEIVVTNESGKWLISEINIGLPSSEKHFVDATCPEQIELETIKSDEFAFTAKFPKGYKAEEITTNSGDRKVTYTIDSHGAEYVFVAHQFKNLSGTLSPSQMKATAEQNRKSYMLGFATYDEDLSNWTYNGVEGAEARFRAKPSGSNIPTKQVWYKSIMQGNMYYTLIILGINWTEENDIFMNSLVSNVKFTPAIEASDVKYKKGDYVLVNTSGSRWDKGIVEKVEADGKYNVRLYEQNKAGIVGAAKLKVDPSPNKKAAGGGSKTPQIKIK